MRFVLLAVCGLRIELDDLDSAPVTCVSTPALRMVLAGVLVELGPDLENFDFAAVMSLGRGDKVDGTV